MGNFLSNVVKLFKHSAQEWSEDHASRLAAAVAYYTIFSLAPLMVIVIAVAGLIWQRSLVQQHLMGQVQGLVGAQGAGFIETLVASKGTVGQGIIASVAGVIALLFGALGAFSELHDSLNAIWDVEEKKVSGFFNNLKKAIKDRMLSFTVIIGIGFLLLVSLVISTALSAFQGTLGNLLAFPPVVLQIINIAISVLVVTVLFALMFKVLPDAKIAWRDVWWGALMTAILFTIGKTLIGLYLGQSNVASSYGAAGSLIVVLLWVYYSAQILFFGAELTQVYANEFGSRIVPDTNAVSTSGEPVAAARRPGPAPARTPVPSVVPVTGSPVEIEHENRQTVRALTGMVAASFVAGIASTLAMLRSERPRRKH
jgi:membrane protein